MSKPFDEWTVLAETETKQYKLINIEGILPKGPYPPCLRMADRALLAGYPGYYSWWCHGLLRRRAKQRSLFSMLDIFHLPPPSRCWEMTVHSGCHTVAFIQISLLGLCKGLTDISFHWHVVQSTTTLAKHEWQEIVKKGCPWDGNISCLGSQSE